ncbi:hypothetical protein J4230_01005 [Candidatus Woesearchaeota archaeon]|nr:hypothetical protein [Candidatus Woesearchaeota archaeon]
MAKSYEKVLAVLEGSAVMLSYNTNILRILNKKGIFTPEILTELSKLIKTKFELENVLNENKFREAQLYKIKKEIEDDRVLEAAFNDNKQLSKL